MCLTYTCFESYISTYKDSAQDYWNEFESKLVEVVDFLAHLQPLRLIEKDKAKPPAHIKNKINKRNRLLNKLNVNPSNSEVRSALKTLNKEIKTFFQKKIFDVKPS